MTAIKEIQEVFEAWQRRVFADMDAKIVEVFAFKNAIKDNYEKLIEATQAIPQDTKLVTELRMKNETLNAAFRQKAYGTWEHRGNFMKQFKVKRGEWEYVMPYIAKTYEETVSDLKDNLKMNADARCKNVMARITAITGEIVDVDLSATETNGIMGLVTGKRGNAAVWIKEVGGTGVRQYHLRTHIALVENKVD